MGNFKIKDMDLYYSDFHALKDINLDIPSTKITAFIGPSGCGKSTLLKSLNRMNDLVEGCKITGEIYRKQSYNNRSWNVCKYGSIFTIFKKVVV